MVLTDDTFNLSYLYQVNMYFIYIFFLYIIVYQVHVVQN